METIRSMQIKESLVRARNKLGEGPLWSKQEGALYWVDIQKNKVERFVPQTGQRSTFHFKNAVTALGIRQAGGFVAATATGIGYWDGRTDKVKLVTRPEKNLLRNRFNDGAVGPDGSFWAGTMCEEVNLKAPPPGSLYRYDLAGKTKAMAAGLHISNGIGWSPDKRFFYLTDSPLRVIYRYQFDPATGEIANQEDFIHTPDQPGVPDGLAVDAEGCIWSARWGGWNVTRYSPEGEALAEIILPVEYPTSCTFGGEDLRTLYITSAWSPLNVQAREEQPLAGDVFAVELDVPGQEAWRFAG